MCVYGSLFSSFIVSHSCTALACARVLKGLQKDKIGKHEKDKHDASSPLMFDAVVVDKHPLDFECGNQSLILS